MKTITKDIYYVGVNDRVKAKFEGLWPLPYGVSYNSYLIDDDKVCLTNLNRQIIATRKTIGKNKVEVARDRILEINPNANVEIHQEFFMPNSSRFRKRAFARELLMSLATRNPFP